MSIYGEGICWALEQVSLFCLPFLPLLNQICLFLSFSCAEYQVDIKKISFFTCATYFSCTFYLLYLECEGPSSLQRFISFHFSSFLLLLLFFSSSITTSHITSLCLLISSTWSHTDLLACPAPFSCFSSLFSRFSRCGHFNSVVESSAHFIQTNFFVQARRPIDLLENERIDRHWKVLKNTTKISKLVSL